MYKLRSGHNWQSAAPALISVCSIIAAFEIGFLAIIFTVSPDHFNPAALCGPAKFMLAVIFGLSIALFFYSSEKITDALEDEDQELYISTFLYYNSGIILSILGAAILISSRFCKHTPWVQAAIVFLWAIGAFIIVKYIRDTRDVLKDYLYDDSLIDNRRWGFRIFHCLQKRFIKKRITDTIEPTEPNQTIDS